MPLTVREMIALLEKDGWYFVTQVGSHRKYRHASKIGSVTVAGNLATTCPSGLSNPSSSRQV